MTMHMSLRLAWHNDGWNGCICKKPCENVYCVGQYSYPGNVIQSERNIEFEQEHAGEPCSKYPCGAACSLSVNAFGKETIIAKVGTPEWYNKNAKPSNITLPPSTACTWSYESMYSDNVIDRTGKRLYDYNQRRQNVEEYFAQFQEGKSLVFYYAGYSNPFSEDEENNYVLVGVSRLKRIGDFYFYEGTTEEEREKYAGGIVWQKPITSNYPDEGFRIPYWKYRDCEEILNKIVIKPSNRSPFKYGSREVTNDDAIELINNFISIVDYLIEIDDDTENWTVRRSWLNSLLAELWEARGPYPGFASVLQCSGLTEFVSSYINLNSEDEMKQFRSDIVDLLEGSTDTVAGISVDKAELRRIRRNHKLRTDNENKLLFDILPRFDLSPVQMENIISSDRMNVSMTATIEDIIDNPYVIFEQYVGYDSDDIIPFYKIDNGVIASPDFGIDNLIYPDDTERLRALCVDELNRIAAHSFGKASTILSQINKRLGRMPEWKSHEYIMRNFEIDLGVLQKALHICKHKDDIYLYLKEVYEDERTVEKTIKMLAERDNIPLKMVVNENGFKDKLWDKDSELNISAKEEYDEILDSQAEICMKIFNKPICVLSGAAGTGKTTVIKAIIDNIVRVHGSATSILVMAPTGKAAERIKNQTNHKSSTIHSFLAKNGWINDNFTLKRSGGSSSADVNTIIIDESSMIDLNLFATLFKAINWNSVQRLILIGDPNQLPPIGRGKVFADTIEWLAKEYPDNIGVLHHNIRQLVNTVKDNGKGILELANIYIQEKQKDDMSSPNDVLEMKKAKDEIYEKIQLKGNGAVDKDLSVYFWEGQDDLDKLLHDVMVSDMERITGNKVGDDFSEGKLWTETIKDKKGNPAPEKVQVISPYRGEFYGTDELNRIMQHTFNPYWIKKFNLEGISYFDKVIQFRNRPQSDPAYAYNTITKKTEKKEIYNGEIGIAVVHGFDYKDNKYKWQGKLDRVQVIFSNESRKDYKYNYGSELWKDSDGRFIPEQKVSENLELAYAISVHKAQGSEFDDVYIVIPERESHLLSMELLYTAITRAQKHVTLFIQGDISTLAKLGNLEKSAVRRINSSIFKFEPLAEDLLYIQNWYSSGKKLSTLSEFFVRSKSEVIIANMLEAEGIPFKYEVPLYADNGSMFLPDFTVTFKGETYYWEHVGMLDRPDYKEHWKKKRKWYEKNFPGKLIVTYESDNLSKEAMKIINEHR